MKTLERLLHISCSWIIALGLTMTSKADILNYVQPSSVEIVAQSDEEIGRSTICENWIAWEAGGKIYARNRQTLQEILVDINSFNPNLDSVYGDKLVYNKEGSIYMYNLESRVNNLIYPKQGDEICSNPKVNGQDIVFRIYFNEIGQDFGWVVKYNTDEEVVYPISNSLNKKTQADIFGKYVVWSEEDVDYPPGEKMFSSKIYDLTNGSEGDACNDVSSIAIYGTNVVGVSNSRSWDNGPTSLILYRLGNGGGVIYSDPGIKDNVAIYENLMVWEEVYKGGYIKAVDLNSRMSVDQFVIAGPNCHKPDVYVDSNGDYNVTYITKTESEVGGEFGSLSLTPYEDYLVSSKIISYPGPSKCGENGTQYLEGDFNRDCYVDIHDLKILAINWMRQGLTNQHPAYGEDPNTLVEYCEVSPEISIGEDYIQLDYDGDCRISFGEYSRLAQNWLKCSDPENRVCDAYWEYKRK